MGPPFELLINALGTEQACFVLGAGASAPHVPTFAQLPQRIAAFARHLGSFPAGPLPDSPLRRLIAPAIERARHASSVEDWKPAAMTSATVAVVLEHLIAEAHWRRLPQYDVFAILPRTSAIVSFNWDGLARVRCPQRPILHPHGLLRPRLVDSAVLDELLDYSQLDETLGVRGWLIPGLVMPGEEDGAEHATMRERLFSLWLNARALVVIGYSFGLASGADYDRVWLDTFVEACVVNSYAPVHIVAPDAEQLRGILVERIKRTVNIHAWPLNWHAFSRVLLAAARLHSVGRIEELRVHRSTLNRVYAAVVERSLAAE